MWKTVLAILLPLSLSAQVICALGTGVAAYKRDADQRPSGDALLLAARVSTALKSICANKCPEIALFRNATAPNIILRVDGGQGKLIYSPPFFETLYRDYGDIGIVAIVAHEVGHGLDDTMGAAWVRNNWKPELRADAWSGCTLAKLELSPGDLAGALKALSRYPPPSQQDWNLRLPALRTGYTNCGGVAAAFDGRSGATKGN